MATLLERIGGDPAVDAAVDRFYEIVLADDRIRHFFAEVDMRRQANHQRPFLKYAFGGLPNYPGRALRKTHERLVNEMGLSDPHFDAVLEDLGRALADLGVGPDLIAEVVATAETTRADVLDRPAGPRAAGRQLASWAGGRRCRRRGRWTSPGGAACRTGGRRGARPRSSRG